MNKQGSAVIVLLAFLIVIVLTSATILFLVKSGVIETTDESEDVSLLNTEFLPLGGVGVLAITDFQFCEFVTDKYVCQGPTDRFELGQEVHFRFVVESSTVNDEIFLVENYRLLDSDGQVLLDVEERSDFNYNAGTSRSQERVIFKDYFILGDDEKEGEYTLELFMENPSLNKKAKLVKQFEVVAPLGEEEWP